MSTSSLIKLIALRPSFVRLTFRQSRQFVLAAVIGLVTSAQAFGVEPKCDAQLRAKSSPQQKFVFETKLALNQSQSEVVSEFWSQQITKAKEMGIRDANLSFIEDIQRLVKLRFGLKLDFSPYWLAHYLRNRPYETAKIWSKQKALVFSREPDDGLTEYTYEFLFYGLSLTSTGRKLIDDTFLSTLSGGICGPPTLWYTYSEFDSSNRAGEYKPKGRGAQFGLISLRADLTLLENILVLGHELTHARDDLKLQLFSNYLKSQTRDIFLEHRAFQNEQRIAIELRENYGLDSRQKHFRSIVDMHELEFKNILNTQYKLSEATIDEYFRAHQWQQTPLKP